MVIIVLRIFVFWCQAELESVLSQCEKAEAKATALDKAKAVLDQTVAELQENLKEETKQKLAAQTRLRQAEEQANNAIERAEEEEEARKALDLKIVTLAAQVSLGFERFFSGNTQLAVFTSLLAFSVFHSCFQLQSF